MTECKTEQRRKNVKCVVCFCVSEQVQFFSVLALSMITNLTQVLVMVMININNSDLNEVPDVSCSL